MPRFFDLELVRVISSKRVGFVLAAKPSGGTTWYEILTSDRNVKWYPECNVEGSSLKLSTGETLHWKLGSLLIDVENDMAKAQWEGGENPYQFQ